MKKIIEYAHSTGNIGDNYIYLTTVNTAEIIPYLEIKIKKQGLYKISFGAGGVKATNSVSSIKGYVSLNLKLYPINEILKTIVAGVSESATSSPPSRCYGSITGIVAVYNLKENSILKLEMDSNYFVVSSTSVGFLEPYIFVEEL